MRVLAPAAVLAPTILFRHVGIIRIWLLLSTFLEKRLSYRGNPVKTTSFSVNLYLPKSSTIELYSGWVVVTKQCRFFLVLTHLDKSSFVTPCCKNTNFLLNSYKSPKWLLIWASKWLEIILLALHNLFLKSFVPNSTNLKPSLVSLFQSDELLLSAK